VCANLCLSACLVLALLFSCNICCLVTTVCLVITVRVIFVILSDCNVSYYAKLLLENIDFKVKKNIITGKQKSIENLNTIITCSD